MFFKSSLNLQQQLKDQLNTFKMKTKLISYEK
jgi:hypothetical protein